MEFVATAVEDQHAHGIGTARLVRESELAGGVSGLSMALAGIITSLMAVAVKWWLT